jgi:hypothetical protein
VHLPFLGEFGQIALEVLEIKIAFTKLKIFVHFFFFKIDGNFENQIINIYLPSEFECPSPLCGLNLVRFQLFKVGGSKVVAPTLNLIFNSSISNICTIFNYWLG